ncbi:MAG TPA: regulatory protein RecX [Bacillota bacterium]|nr:regulatory protein RecX [Bacillota bacterium]
MRAHLASKGFQEEEIEEELRFLQELHYVDDGRYCGAYIEYGIRKGRGPVRLQRELAEKGIDGELIRQALEESFDRRTERDMAMEEAQKLLNRGGGPDEKTIAKIGRKLASSGYHTDIIYDVIGRIRKS